MESDVQKKVECFVYLCWEPLVQLCIHVLLLHLTFKTTTRLLASFFVIYLAALLTCSNVLGWKTVSENTTLKHAIKLTEGKKNREELLQRQQQMSKFAICPFKNWRTKMAHRLNMGELPRKSLRVNCFTFGDERRGRAMCCAVLHS